MLNKNKKSLVRDLHKPQKMKGWKSCWAYLLTTVLSFSICLPVSLAAGTETFGTNGDIVGTSYAYSEAVGFVDLNVCDADDADGSCTIGDGVVIQADDMLHLVKMYDGVSDFNYILRGYAWTEVAGWIKFGDVSATAPYLNIDESTYGVNLLPSEADKILDGYAWSEKVGWIFFNSNGVLKDSANQDETNYGVYVEADGDVKGYAYSESLGWFDLGASLPITLDFNTVSSDEVTVSGTMVTLGSDASLNGLDNNGQIMAFTGTGEYLVKWSEAGFVKDGETSLVVAKYGDTSWLPNDETCAENDRCLAVGNINGDGNFSLNVPKTVTFLVVTANNYDKKIIDIAGITSNTILTGDDVKLHLIGDFAETGKGKDQNYTEEEIIELVEYVKFVGDVPMPCYSGENIPAAIDDACWSTKILKSTDSRYESSPDGLLGDADGERLYYFISNNSIEGLPYYMYSDMNPYTIAELENNEWMMDFAKVGEGKKTTEEIVELVEYVDGSQLPEIVPCYKAETVDGVVDSAALTANCWATGEEMSTSYRYKTYADDVVSDVDGERFYYYVSNKWSDKWLMNPYPVDIFYKNKLPVGMSSWNDL